MAVVLAIPPATWPNGTRTYGPVAAPSGIHELDITIDVAQQSLGTKVWIAAEASSDGGATWWGAQADFDGPWLDRDGVTRTDVTLTVGLPVPPTHLRGTITVENGPLHTNGGEIAVT